MAKRDSITISSVIGIASRIIARSMFPFRIFASSPDIARRNIFHVREIFLANRFKRVEISVFNKFKNEFLKITKEGEMQLNYQFKNNCGYLEMSGGRLKKIILIPKQPPQ
jgi:hypothetical protein